MKPTSADTSVPTSETIRWPWLAVQLRLSIPILFNKHSFAGISAFQDRFVNQESVGRVVLDNQMRGALEVDFNFVLGLALVRMNWPEQPSVTVNSLSWPSIRLAIAYFRLK
jgi:hypothetical protein